MRAESKQERRLWGFARDKLRETFPDMTQTEMAELEDAFCQGWRGHNAQHHAERPKGAIA